MKAAITSAAWLLKQQVTRPQVGNRCVVLRVSVGVPVEPPPHGILSQRRVHRRDGLEGILQILRYFACFPAENTS